jgi:hypothetical protein
MPVLAGKLLAKWIRQNITTGILYKVPLKTVITHRINLIEICFVTTKTHLVVTKQLNIQNRIF